jgi:hypothetical protein
VQAGWPHKKRECPGELHPFWEDRHEFRVVDGLVFDADDRVVVPSSMRRPALELLHAGHAGMNSMYDRARGSVRWPKLTNCIAEFVKSCAVCQRTQPARQKEPMLPREVPAGPGVEYTADFAVFRGQRFLVVVDVFSNFWDAVPVSSEGAQGTCNACMKFFGAFGPPRGFRSDGGSGLQSQEFRSFLVRWGVVWLPPSSAEYPQSNGKAESAVKAFKLLKERVRSPEEYYFGLMMWRATRNRSGLSPAELFLGRILATPLQRPCQNTVAWSDVKQTIEGNQISQKRTYDRGSRDIVAPVAGQVVQISVGKKRVEGTVVGPAVQPRAVHVQLPSGHVSTRNRRQLRVVPSPN